MTYVGVNVANDGVGVTVGVGVTTTDVVGIVTV